MSKFIRIEVGLFPSPLAKRNCLLTASNLIFEKPIENGFAHGELMLPDMTWNKQLSMTEDDVFYLEQYALDNSPLIWELSREGNGCLQ